MLIVSLSMLLCVWYLLSIRKADSGYSTMIRKAIGLEGIEGKANKPGYDH